MISIIYQLVTLDVNITKVIKVKVFFSLAFGMNIIIYVHCRMYIVQSVDISINKTKVA